MPVRASCIAAVLALVAGLTACSRDQPPPTLVVGNDMMAAVAVAAFGDDARVEVHDSADANWLLDELAPIPYGEGPQWLGPPDPTGDPPYLGQDDPAFWLEPDRVVQAGRLLDPPVPFDDAARERTEERLAALRETMRRADEQVQALLFDLPQERRVVATDNIRLGYFAERYGLQIRPIEGTGALGDLDLDRLGPPGSPTGTLDGLIVEVARRLAHAGG